MKPIATVPVFCSFVQIMFFWFRATPSKFFAPFPMFSSLDFALPRHIGQCFVHSFLFFIWTNCRIRRRRQNQDDVQKRADRALKLVQMGKLSAGRLALDGAQVADGNQATLNDLTDTRRRPAVPRAPLSQFVLESQPEVFSDEGLFVQSLRSSRRGAAAGPSGMTADHLQPVDTERDTSLFQLALARGQAPVAAVEGVRMGRITTLKKPNGGIRGIVVGDILRRLVARTMAKQMARVEAATAPFQCALTTKVGCESVAHILQSLTDQDERATIVSINGVGAYDPISRNAMLEGLARVPEGDRLLPFVRHFYGSPSADLWEDEAGETH